jgi:hypothetical protein
MKHGTLASPLTRTCHPCPHLAGDLRPGHPSVLASQVARLPMSREQVAAMASALLAEAAERKASPYLVAHLGKSMWRVAIVVTSATEEELTPR